MELNALGPSGPFRARRREPVEDVAGRPVGELSLVPALFVTRAVSELRKAAVADLDRRAEALARAGELFHAATIDGLDPTTYRYLVSRISGIPIATVRATSEHLVQLTANARKNIEFAQPHGSIMDWRDPEAREGRALWTRRGDVFGVHAAGNHPAVQLDWLDAVILGYRVAVRPSRREPLTPHRLVSALWLAGLEEQVILLPTDHAAADELLRAADLSMVYGGDEVMQKYANEPSVRRMGPGRSKILVTAGFSGEETVDLVVDSIVADGGVGCVNATAVLVEGDPAPLAEAVAARLATIPSLPPEDDAARLPAQPIATARRLEEHLRMTARGATALLGGGGIVDVLDDGAAVLRPAVHQLEDATAPQLRAELPFPCVWFAPWSRPEGVGPLRDTLVLTALTDDEELVERMAHEPTIRNLYVGRWPTYWSEPRLPHDGYLADFLMRPKTIARR